MFVVAFYLFYQESTALNKMIDEDPAIAKEMLYSLSKEVFRMSKLRTPLLEQASPRFLCVFGRWVRLECAHSRPTCGLEA